MLNIKKYQSDRGFTIVELLIVIVIIAILAAITIVAYNGIQQRARNTANAESAGQLRTKIESWNSVKGAYPSVAQVEGGMALTSGEKDPAPEAVLDANLRDKIQTGTNAITAEKPLKVTACGTTGMRVTYWQDSAASAAKTIDAGTGC